MSVVMAAAQDTGKDMQKDQQRGLHDQKQLHKDEREELEDDTGDIAIRHGAAAGVAGGAAVGGAAAGLASGGIAAPAGAAVGGLIGSAVGGILGGETSEAGHVDVVAANSDGMTAEVIDEASMPRAEVSEARHAESSHQA